MPLASRLSHRQACDKIVAEELTLTGSIGVVTGTIAPTAAAV